MGRGWGGGEGGGAWAGGKACASTLQKGALNVLSWGDQGGAGEPETCLKIIDLQGLLLCQLGVTGCQGGGLGLGKVGREGPVQ